MPKWSEPVQRGFRSVRQIVIDKAEGDFVWDLDGNRYIDFQNGWATNPLGNCHPEILEAVEAANRRFGFHYDHPSALRPGRNARRHHAGQGAATNKLRGVRY